jgi:hypothetical protein
MAHAHGADGIARAARLGCRSIEHASFIDQDGIDACLAADCWIVPTFLVGKRELFRVYSIALFIFRLILSGEYYNETGSSSQAQDRMIELQVGFGANLFNSECSDILRVTEKYK